MIEVIVYDILRNAFISPHLANGMAVFPFFLVTDSLPRIFSNKQVRVTA